MKIEDLCCAKTSSAESLNSLALRAQWLQPGSHVASFCNLGKTRCRSSQTTLRDGAGCAAWDISSLPKTAFTKDLKRYHRHGALLSRVILCCFGACVCMCVYVFVRVSVLTKGRAWVRAQRARLQKQATNRRIILTRGASSHRSGHSPFYIKNFSSAQGTGQQPVPPVSLEDAPAEKLKLKNDRLKLLESFSKNRINLEVYAAEETQVLGHEGGQDEADSRGEGFGMKRGGARKSKSFELPHNRAIDRLRCQVDYFTRRLSVGDLQDQHLPSVEDGETRASEDSVVCASGGGSKGERMGAFGRRVRSSVAEGSHVVGPSSAKNKLLESLSLAHGTSQAPFSSPSLSPPRGDRLNPRPHALEAMTLGPRASGVSSLQWGDSSRQHEAASPHPGQSKFVWNGPESPVPGERSPMAGARADPY